MSEALYSYPGVYREEIFPKPEPKLPTGVPGFVGFAKPKYDLRLMSVAARDDLPNNGRNLVIVALVGSVLHIRIFDASGEKIVDKAEQELVSRETLKALTYRLQPLPDVSGLSDEDRQKIIAEAIAISITLYAQPIALHHREDFTLYFEADEQGYLAEAVSGFFANGGVRCYVACVIRPDTAMEQKETLQKAVESLLPLHDLDLIAVPDAVSLPEADLYKLQLQAWLLTHCAEQGDRFALLDTLRGRAPANVEDDLKDLKRILEGNARTAAKWGALYYPWVGVGQDRSVPPCGHVAGIYARTDAKVGVFKAPANEEVIGALDLDSEVGNDAQGELNTWGINCLRSFPGRGIRLWGARTLSDDARWRYVNVQRLFITVRRWIDLNMSWAAFESSTLQLWTRVEREIRGYLSNLWHMGALQGRTPEEAFYVKCDAETNPPDAPTDRLVTELGLAPTAPAEFVVVRIVHRPLEG